MQKLKKQHGFLFRLILKQIARRALKLPGTGARQLDRFAAGITGALPSPADGTDVILAACNDAYFHLFAVDLIQSIERLGNRQALHIHLLEPSEEVVQQAEALKRTLKIVALTFTVDRCVLADSLAHRPIYYTAARFLLAPLILKQGAKRLLIIDVDAVMNSAPWPLFGPDSVATSGGFIFRPGMRRPWYKVLASAVFFNGSAGSVRLAEALAQSLAATLAYRPKYHIDQILPHYLCTFAPRYVPGFSTIDIPEKMMGYDYEADTAFWTVKGKSNIVRFQARKKMLIDTPLPEAV
jgi:hypothetical protein